MGLRITVIIGIFGLLFSSLVINLYNIQLNKGEEYQAQAASIQKLNDALSAKRGSIYFTDKDGNRISAVINKDYPVIYAVPSEVTDPIRTAQVLGAFIGLSRDELIPILSKKDDPYEPLVRRATPEQISLLDKEKLPGIEKKNESKRFYPLGKVASHLIGFSSIAKSGRYGVESYYDDRLTGTPGAANGDKVIRSVDGGDVYLTIDRNIQVEAEKTLDNLVTNFQATGGTIIVADPKTGKILAMTSRPNFDPNDYNKFDIKTFLNPAVQSVYEPGSIFKVITMSAGIDSGKITPDTTYIDTGSLTLNGKTIKNWDLKAHGKLTMANVIEKSLNTGAAFAERVMGHSIFHDYVVKFGFKEKTNIDLPGEITGSLRPIESDLRDINFATASFGQGISVSPISLITAISAIANGGNLMRPYINSELQPQVTRRVISEDTSRKVVAMMVSAVEKNILAKVNGYNVAGKTGTAEVPNFNTGGYTREVINTYVGFAPAYDPKFIILIKLDKPAGAPLSGITVVPAFRELAQYILNYYQVPPDNISR